MNALLLRQIEHDLRGLQWQNSGGKGSRPKPIPLPSEKTRGDRPKTQTTGEDIARRLRNLGLIPPGSD